MHTGGDVHNIVVIPSEIPLISSLPLPTNVSLLISANDSMGDPIRTTLNFALSKFSKVLHGST
jgi:hypothetical protein